jgi:hypothetical protein
MFKLQDKPGRLKFALELDNLSAALHADKGDTKGQVRKLSEIVIEISTKNNLPTFRSKCSANNYEADGETNLESTH